MTVLAPSPPPQPAVVLSADEKLSTSAVERKIRSMGFGMFQLWQLSLISCVWFLKGAGDYIFTRIYQSEPSANAFLTVTAALSGRSAAYFVSSFVPSRRFGILVSLLLTCASLLIFTILPPALTSLAFFSFALAFGLPPSYALARDILPRKFTVLGFGLLGVANVLGGFFGFFCEWLGAATVPETAWMEAAQLLIIPGLLSLAVCSSQIHESGVYLAQKGMYVEVNILLKKIAVWNAKEGRVRFVAGSDDDGVEEPEDAGCLHVVKGLLSPATDATRTLIRKPGGLKILTGFALSSCIFSFFYFRVGAGFEVVAAANAAAVVLATILLLRISRKMQLGALLVMLSGGYLAFLGKTGHFRGYGELGFLLGAAALKIAADGEVVSFFDGRERVAGVAMCLGFATSLQSGLEFAASVGINAQEIFFAFCVIGAAVVLATGWTGETDETVLEEKEKLIS